ncbi:hypothetical protein L484_022373 [Morus notabilis]|uniref:Uncharacterized protein n=1 Tax=Morus notabilis TaxID=981085 RepID=W9QRP2_9ROSA|nr:hypothetical protein L484_022373 [Morus notabilis]
MVPCLWDKEIGAAAGLAGPGACLHKGQRCGGSSNAGCAESGNGVVDPKAAAEMGGGRAVPAARREEAREWRLGRLRDG